MSAREATKDAPIGGQAVLEGVMMRGVSVWAVAVRKPSDEQLAAGGADSKEGAKGEIEVISEPLVSWTKRHRLLRVPIERGVVALAESLRIGFRQTVRGLQAGGLYRAQVSFRWYSADGELIERTRRTSGACRQFDAVPNLTTVLLRAESTTVPGVVRYMMRVANTGAAPAVDVDARLSVDGGVVDTVTIASLEPGASRDVAVLGPECTSSVSSTADPDGVIVESSEDDNAHTVTCQA